MIRASAHTVLVEGAGIIGLSCALELRQRGVHVTVTDPNPPARGASWAAAGMISPSFEMGMEALEGGRVNPVLSQMAFVGAITWPGFASRVEAASGMASGYDRDASLALWRRAELRRMEKFCAALVADHYVERLPLEALAALEPNLAAHDIVALRLPRDTQVNNRAFLTALLAAVAREGVTLTREPQERGHYDAVLVTKGWQSPGVGAIKGQMLSLARSPGQPGTVVRMGSLYLVPKPDRLVIGATMEPGVTDRTVDPDAVEALRLRAAALYPALARHEVIETWAGIRPATPDRAPLMGQLASGEFIAAGHHRNGILLAPLTAHMMADHILQALGVPCVRDELHEGFMAALRPDRFEPVRSPERERTEQDG